MADRIFVNGFIVKTKQTQYGDLTKISIRVSDFAKFVKQHADNDWLNLVIKSNKDGKRWAELDTWKPDATKSNEVSNQASNEPEGNLPEPDDLPF